MGEDGSEGRPRLGLSVQVPAVRLPRDYRRAEELRALARDGVAGFLVFGGDRDLLPAFVTSLRRAAGRPLLIMTDAERGLGQQVHGCLSLPPLMAVGATLSEERAYEHGRLTALEARAMGVNMVLAPVLDVLSHATNPIIGNRSIGANPAIVASLGAAWISGAQDQGVLACAKHFPGHGDTNEDSHDALPVVHASREVLHARELLPFRAAVQAGVGAIMTAHVAYPALDPRPRLPASLSQPILDTLLRGDMGFGGLVVSDALVMSGLLLAGDEGEPLEEPEAAVRCVQAGCDLLLHPVAPYAVADALEAAAEASRVDLVAARSRIALTLADLVVDGPGPGAPALAAEHLYDAYGLARDSVTVVADSGRRLPLTRTAGQTWLALLIDDDDEPARAAPFRERAADFAAGVVRVSHWDPEGPDATLLRRVDAADGVLLAVACDQRAWKGRAGLKPELVALVTSVLERAGDRVVGLLLGAPGVLADLPVLPSTLVACWGDAPVCVRAALDAVLSGTPMRGLDPGA